VGQMTQPSIESLKEELLLRFRLQSHQVHCTVLQ